MLVKTKVLTAAIALLATLVVTLPIALGQSNANETKYKKVDLNSIARGEYEPQASHVKKTSRNEIRSVIVSGNPDENQIFARDYMLTVYGWDADQYSCLVTLWNYESGWRADAHNKSSGAYGIPQALPGSKMSSAGSDWQTNPQTQIIWGLGYIAGRYGTPCGAYNNWSKKGWY